MTNDQMRAARMTRKAGRRLALGIVMPLAVLVAFLVAFAHGGRGPLLYVVVSCAAAAALGRKR